MNEETMLELIKNETMKMKKERTIMICMTIIMSLLIVALISFVGFYFNYQLNTEWVETTEIIVESDDNGHAIYNEGNNAVVGGIINGNGNKESNQN